MRDSGQKQLLMLNNIDLLRLPSLQLQNSAIEPQQPKNIQMVSFQRLLEQNLVILQIYLYFMLHIAMF